MGLRFSYRIFFCFKYSALLVLFTSISTAGGIKIFSKTQDPLNYVKVLAVASGQSLNTTKTLDDSKDAAGYLNKFDVSSWKEWGPHDRIKFAVLILSELKVGKQWLAAYKKSMGYKTEKEIFKNIKPGNVSRTEAVLTRYFDTISGNEKREREVTVFLELEQSLEEVVMDLGHELVHASLRPAWDPYDPDLTPFRYIKASIEGRGGELEAVMNECKVAMELMKTFDMKVNRCKRYLHPSTQEISKMEIKKDFYRVGNWETQFVFELGHDSKQFPLLSGEDPELYSSTGRAPYPVALLEEYKGIIKSACENSYQRIVMSSTDEGRRPASKIIGKAVSKSKRFFKNRCADWFFAEKHNKNNDSDNKDIFNFLSFY